MKPIKGSQLTPNNVQEQCVRVQKVYDWVFDAISTDSGIVLPPDCAEAIDLAVRENRVPLDVTCELPELGGFFPLDPPDTNGNALCTVSSKIERRPIPINGTLVDLAIVKVIFTIKPLVTITDRTGTIICQFRPVISESRRLVVCAPEPFTADNVFCRLISLNCETNFIETGIPDLGLQIMLDICFEIQVEADVKLEILGKFCFPRPNDIDIPTAGVCPPLEWPAPCEIFSNDDTDGQAIVHTGPLSPDVTLIVNPVLFPTTLAQDVEILNLEPGSYTTKLDAEIGNNCVLEGSTLRWRVDALLYPTSTVEQSFTFKATKFGFPDYTEELGAQMLTVKGSGELYFDDPSVPNLTVRFTLYVIENTGDADDSYAIILTDMANNVLIELQGASLKFVPDNDIVVQDCINFPNNLS
ncbi:MAG: hypothetical protein QM671_27785 [Bacillus sp. (in: firmicutes)]|uniref:hypothetical protein n=1 Tax=Bacillus sp. TaxID=1409 RepID=UPI0039E4EEFC